LNFGQTIWDKTKVLLGTSWGIYLKTFWEDDKNTKLRIKTKKKKFLSPLPFQIKNI
jgi:hypothetical protein